MVMAMDNYYPQDRLLEIWKTINSLHLSYLEMDESPQKLEQRNKLEECIREYLCLAPHNQKFYLPETAEVLHRSARVKNDFSGYKASSGWNAIGIYAGNLLGQPWRKEYREVKMYSGFYVHQIEANLVGAEIMFEAMGYKHVGNGVLVLEGPICPDRVSQVSQDSLVAYVECQILKAIWEEVSNTFKISWLEVLEFREAHLCSPKQSVQNLIYRFHQRQFQEHNRGYSQGPDVYQTNTRYNPSIAQPHNVIPTNHVFPPMSGHTHVPQMPTPQYIYGSNGCYPNNYNTYAPVARPPHNYHYPHVPMTYQQPPVIKPPYYGNNHYYTNGYTPAPQPNYMYPLPAAAAAGQVIEIEPHVGNTYDIPDGPSSRSHKPLYSSPSNELYRNKDDPELKNNNNNRDTDREEGSGTFETWDYVYRNLESQGYSKDLGERGDVLSPPLGTERKCAIKEAKKVRSIDLEEGMHNLSISRPLKVDDKIKHKDSNMYRNSDLTQSSSYDNLSTHDNVPIKTQPKALVSSKTLPREKSLDATEQLYAGAKETHSKTLDTRKAKKGDSSEKSKQHNLRVASKSSSGKESKGAGASATSPKWECKTCTYLNEGAQQICEMCGKSKNTITQEMEVGGSQCSYCTLVNRKENKQCDACGYSLKDSPTYI